MCAPICTPPRQPSFPSFAPRTIPVVHALGGPGVTRTVFDAELNVFRGSIEVDRPQTVQTVWPGYRGGLGSWLSEWMPGDVRPDPQGKHHNHGPCHRRCHGSRHTIPVSKAFWPFSLAPHAPTPSNWAGVRHTRPGVRPTRCGSHGSGGAPRLSEALHGLREP